MKRETEQKSDILSRWRKEFNCQAICLVGSMRQQPGLPDSLILYKGIHIWIEFKNPETPTRTIQTIIHRRFLEHGVKVWIVRFMTENEWMIENHTPSPHLIKFQRVGEGARELFHALHILESSRLEKERSTKNLPMELAPINSGTSQ